MYGEKEGQDGLCKKWRTVFYENSILEFYKHLYLYTYSKRVKKGER